MVETGEFMEITGQPGSVRDSKTKKKVETLRKIPAREFLSHHICVYKCSLTYTHVFIYTKNKIIYK